MRLNRLVRQLTDAGIDQAGIEALILLELASGMSREEIISDDIQLTHEQEAKLESLISQRKSKPIAYLLGHKEFYGYKFLVNENVLIPRPESEDMIVIALELTNIEEVIDIGCGSGCLGISYALERGRMGADAPQLTLLDKSKEALQVAKRNGENHKVSGQHVNQDINCENPRDWLPNSGLVLANLPYLPLEKRNTYEQRSKDLRAEPKMALYAADGGLQLYKRLFDICRNNQLAIITESLTSQHQEMVSIARSHGYHYVKTLGLSQLFQRDGDEVVS